MDTGGLIDISRPVASSSRAGPGCHAGCRGVTFCGHGQTCHPQVNKKNNNTNKEVVRRKSQRSTCEFISLANSQQREDSFKSKFRRRGVAKHIVFAAVLCCLVGCEARSSVKGTPPRLNGKAKVKVTATAGQLVVLPCPITADPPPLMTWSVNGHPVTGSRFKVGDDLRIREVSTSDEGRYRCVGRNAFGVADHEIKLSVRDPEEISSPSKPRFTMPGKMRNKNVAKPEGRSLRLRCRARGYPVPDIEWYKDGNLTQPPGSRKHQAWSFSIRQLAPIDSGSYRCRVWNSEGEINFTYQVRVVEQLSERPVLLEPHPMNTTVQVGGMTAIQCRVQSRVEPTVKWIKRLDDRPMAPYGSDATQSIITVDDRHYMILPTQEMLRLDNGLYLNKLVIRGATETHAGMYICLAANTMGYNYKFAFLNVVTGPVSAPLRSTSLPRTKLLPGSRSIQKSSLSLPAIIGVPAGIGLVMVVFLAWFCQRRREQGLKGESANVVVSGSDRLSALGSSETKSSTRSTPVPHDEDEREPLDGGMEQRTAGIGGENYCSYNHRLPPTAGTPLLTVTEPDESEFDVPPTDDDDGYYVPAPPPCSEAPSSCRSPSEKRLTFHLEAPPPPPPSQKSASSLSSCPNTRPPQYPHHYYYMHPPGGSRRHHHHHGHHSRSGHHHYAGH